MIHIKDITDKLALKYGISKGSAYHMAESQFTFIRQTISEGKMEGVQLIYFGKFVAKPNRIVMLNKLRENARKRREQTKEHIGGLEKHDMVNPKDRKDGTS